MSKNPVGPAEAMIKKVEDVTGIPSAAFDNAVGKSAFGRGTPEQIQLVTQALINKGKLEEVRKKYDAMPAAEFNAFHGGVSRPISDENAIKLLQWDYGVGVDCAGYAQQAFLDAHGGGRGKFGLRDIGNEDLYSLQGNGAFQRSLTPINARPGDLLILGPPPGDTAGHTLLIRDRRELTAADKVGLHGIGSFASASDKVHVLEVDSSWGASYGDVTAGGAQRRKFLYNETTKQWADLSYGVVKPSPGGPYGGHPVDGVYHPKG
jgi:hypothetical protein